MVYVDNIFLTMIPSLLKQKLIHFTGSDFYECTIDTLFHCCQKCPTSCNNYVETKRFSSWELALSQSVILFLVSVLVFVEMNRKHCFWEHTLYIDTFTFLLKISIDICISKSVSVFTHIHSMRESAEKFFTLPKKEVPHFLKFIIEFFVWKG